MAEEKKNTGKPKTSMFALVQAGKEEAKKVQSINLFHHNRLQKRKFRKYNQKPAPQNQLKLLLQYKKKKSFRKMRI